LWDSSSEALLWLNGVPVQGLNGGGSKWKREMWKQIKEKERKEEKKEKSRGAKDKKGEGRNETLFSSPFFSFPSFPLCVSCRLFPSVLFWISLEGDDRRAEYLVTKSAHGGEKLAFYVEMVRKKRREDRKKWEENERKGKRELKRHGE
jgi:hypothetical protein